MPVPHHSVSTGQMPFLPPNQALKDILVISVYSYRCCLSALISLDSSILFMMQFSPQTLEFLHWVDSGWQERYPACKKTSAAPKTNNYIKKIVFFYYNLKAARRKISRAVHNTCINVTYAFCKRRHRSTLNRFWKYSKIPCHKPWGYGWNVV